MRLDLRRMGTRLALQVLLLGIFAALVWFEALKIFIYFNPRSIDGKFQTLTSLQLLGSGQVPFRDFPLYLGLGVVNWTRLTSLAFDRDLMGAQQGAIAACGLAFLSTLVVLMALARVPQRFWPSGLVIGAVIALLAPIGRLETLLRPGTSLLGIRTFGAILACIAVWATESAWRDRGAYARIGRPLVWGATAGAALCWSNDFGVGAALSLLIVLVAWMQRPFRAPAFLVALLLFLGAAAAVQALVLAAFGATPWEWWRSNVIATAGDQFWLFYPAHENAAAFTLVDVVLMAFGIRSFPYAPLVSSAVMAAAAAHSAFLLTALRSAATLEPREVALVQFSMSAWAGAMIASVGGHFTDHYWALFIVSAPFAAAAFLRRIDSGQRLGSEPRREPPGTTALAACAASVVLLLAVWIAGAWAFETRIGSWLFARAHRAGDELARTGPVEAGLPSALVRDLGTLATLRDSFDRCQVAPGERVVEAYASLVGAALGAVPSGRASSIIHVLGDEGRLAFTRLLQDRPPLLATTIAQDYDGWAHWNLRARWFWYRALLDRYRPVARTDQQIVWLRDGSARPRATAGACTIEQVAPDRVRLVIPSAAVSAPLAEVTLDYASGPGAGMLPLRPLRRVVTLEEGRTNKVVAGQPVSYASYGIPPHGEGFSTVFQPGADESSIDLVSHPLGRSVVQVTACRVRFLDYDPAAALPRVGETLEGPSTLRTAICPR